jgi:hypothetical protein
VHKEKILATEILETVVKNTSADKISINDLIVAMDAGGFGLIMLIFSLPMIFPLPPPFPSIFSIPPVIFSVQMMFGYRAPKLPKRFGNMSIKRVMLANLVEKSVHYLKKAEKLLRPRLYFLSTGIFERIIGFFTFIFSISVLLPLPLSNFIPGLGVLITAFGLVGKDGVMIMIGILIGSAGIAITTAATFFGVEFIFKIYHLIEHYIISFL